jgi:ParB-like chromosome segregation protein Spo0J
MNVFEVPINELSNDPANVRRHPEEQINRLIAILRRFGQQMPLVVDANNVVRVGNARLEAMRRLGWEKVQVVRSDLSGADMVAFAIADNRAPDGSDFDPDGLSATLSALKDQGQDLAGLGFSPEDFAAMVPTPAEPVAPPAEFPAVDENIPTEHECPKCKYRWSGSTAPAEAA